MASPLETRATLLLRLRDSGDDASWSEFVEIYTPLIFSFCLKRGIDREETADITQEVMKSVARAMRGFDYDPARGTFRSWLFTAVRHEIGRSVRKQRQRPLTAGDTQILKRLEQTPDPGEHADWELDYRRQLLQWALDAVRPEFNERIWHAFAATAVENRDPAEVADSLGMSRNAVYIARARVIRRLGQRIHSVAGERWEIDAAGKEP